MARTTKAETEKMTRGAQVALRTFPAAVEVFQELADQKKWSLSKWCEEMLLQAAAAELKKQGKPAKKIEDLL